MWLPGVVQGEKLPRQGNRNSPCCDSIGRPITQYELCTPHAEQVANASGPRAGRSSDEE
jgi:hypothetical protein